MDLLTFDPVLCLKQLVAIRKDLAAGEAGRALSQYLERYEELAVRVPIEWSLLERLGPGSEEVPSVASWPSDMLARPSGGALAFVATQLAGEDLPLPSGLARLAPIPLAFRVSIAAAWLARPEGLCPTEPELRTRFALWLAEAREAIGSCLLASAELGDEALLRRLGPLWLAKGISHPDAPEQIERASRTPGLADLAREAVHAAIGRFHHDSRALLVLLRAAFVLGSFRPVAALGEILSSQPDVKPAEQRRALALRLGALAELEDADDVATEYRSRWQPLGAPFPHPEWLLYAFQRKGEAALEQHLLQSAEISPATDRWVLLSRELVRKRAPERADLEAWVALYQERRQDERVLVGLSNVLIRSAPLLREEQIERLDLLGRWQTLARHEPYRELAGAFLVLLQPSDDERIAAFEEILADAPLVSAHVRRVARAYVASLRRTRQWRRLLDLDRRRPDLFDLACPFKERELARLLGRLIELPASESDEAELRRWCAGWERLLGLPLASRELVEVLESFLLLRRELAARVPGLLEHELMGDVELQLLRRAKAQAERLLEHRVDAGTIGPRLHTARLEAAFAILRDLDPVGEGDEHV